MTDHPHGAMFRAIVPHQHSRVTYVELFFDLVFVFAVTQIAHAARPFYTAGRAAGHLLFLAVWWCGSSPLDHQLARS
jgi:low temperature requirement protein LtrA